MRKLLKSKKALSPVVAAIILIAVTVAVSIAVAAWMGSMTFTFMETEELKITSGTFETVASAPDTITLVVVNTGSTDLTLTAATVVGSDDDVTLTATDIDTDNTDDIISAGATETVTLSIAEPDNLDSGNAYTVQLVTSKGNTFTYKGNA